MVTATALCISSLSFTVRADSSKVVTLGANLTDEQKETMYEYFGTSANEVETITVTNADEREYLEGIASEEQIGTRTYSCSYVEPTSSGGIQVTTANLTYVTSSMISSTLLTSGVENCNVVAASPIEVSGTGALTGIMMAYETASGEELDDGQKAAATEELVTTSELADEYGDKTATGLINDVKEQVIEDDISDASEIEDIVDDAADTYNITLTEDQMEKITSLMETISQYDYDVNALKDTLDNLNGESGGFFSNLWDSIVGFFTGDSSDEGILGNIQENVLGSDVVTDSTLETSDSDDEDENGGFWDSIVNFFKDLFGGGDDEADAEEDEGSDVSEDTVEQTDTESSANDEGTTSDTENIDNTSDADNPEEDDASFEDANDITTDPENDNASEESNTETENASPGDAESAIE